LPAASSTLVFTNVRSQAEIWYQLLLEARPEWAGHHRAAPRLAGPGTREWVERGLKDGELRAVVCTSSLDLGVDFLPVERVLQIGSAKGVARMLQRAGRSGHAPGRPSARHAGAHAHMEIVEALRPRARPRRGRIEARIPPGQPLDVLVQHLVTVALGGGFVADACTKRCAPPGRIAISRGPSSTGPRTSASGAARAARRLSRLPPHRARRGRRVARARCAAWRERHRLNVGTIVSDASDAGEVPHGRQHRHDGGRLHRPPAGGRLLSLRGPAAGIRPRPRHGGLCAQGHGKNKGTVPTWQGSKMALSTELARRRAGACCSAADEGEFPDPELQAARPMLETQQQRLSLHPDAAHAAGRDASSSREGSTCMSTRSPAGTCTWGWRACWRGGWRASGRTLFQHLGQRLRLRAGERRADSTVLLPCCT
jgi:ATP-dependent Lhr-like helicase